MYRGAGAGRGSVRGADANAGRLSWNDVALALAGEDERSRRSAGRLDRAGPDDEQAEADHFLAGALAAGFLVDLPGVFLVAVLMAAAVSVSRRA